MQSKTMGIILTFLMILMPFCRAAGGEEEVLNGGEVQVFSNYLRYHSREDMYYLTDDLRIHYRDYLITGLEGEIHEAEDLIYITGEVVIEQGANLLTGEQFTFHFTDEHMILEEDFDVLYHREEDGEQIPLEITGQRLEIFDDGEQFRAYEQVVLLYKNYRITADHLDYDELKQEIYFSGGVVVEDSETDRLLKSSEFLYWLDDDSYEAIGNVEAEFFEGR